MALHQLTARTVETARPKTKEYLLADGNKLFLRVKSDGAKGWVFVFTAPDGRRRKAGLGEYPGTSLAAAREKSATLNTQLAAGIDPLAAKVAARASAKAMSTRTLGAMLSGYVGHLRGAKKPSADDVERTIKLHLPEETQGMLARDVKKEHLLPAVSKLVEAGKLRTAGKLRSILSTAFELAIEADDSPSVGAAMRGFSIEINPVTRIGRVTGGNGRPGMRALSLAEFQTYLTSVEAMPESDIRDLLLIAAYAGGQRVLQLIGASLEHGDIVILDTKGRRSEPRVHRVPLIGRALAIVEARNNRLFCITDAKAAKRMQLQASDAVKAISAEMGGDPFSMGDIRRTIETLLAGARISGEHRAQLMSHGITGVQARHYDRHAYRAEKIAALKALARLITSKPAGKVVQLHA